VIPDGALHLLPFEALVFEPRDANRGARFWLDDGPAVRYASSASSWLALEARRAARAGSGSITSALSVSDPHFDRHADSTWPALPGTRLESRALAQALAPAPVTVLEGDSATERAARLEMPRARLLHFATHGFVTSRRSDVLAGLAFAPPADSVASAEDDGLLQLYEIYALPLDAELAVLSACETARGARVAGEGVFTLSRGFLAAGAARAIASLWNVNDASTAALMSALFQGVPAAARAGGSPDWTRLLRDAKRAVRAQPQWSAPFHWAPFVLSGSR
jgi:CHAT domain-containing protein